MASTAPTPLSTAELPPGSLYVGSEVGRLHRVILHRPGPELGRLTPENKDEFLFDDVVWAERAAEEHDVLASILRGRGVEVLYLEDLLTETLALPDAREEVLRASLQSVVLGVTLGPAVLEWLETLGPRELSRRLIGGVTFAELPFASRSLTALAARPDDFVLPPLPNHLYTRDASSWAYGGVSLHAMEKPVRRRETIHYAAIYRHHPLFAPLRPPMWSNGIGAGATLEGGDVLVIGNGCLLVGMSERSHPAAVELYARRLFDAGAADRVIAVQVLQGRATIHVDTLLTMVDVDAFTAYPPACRLPAYTLTRSRRGVHAEPEQRLFEAVARALGLPRVRVIETGGDASTARREQWDEANNVLAVAPGVVVAYERNVRTNLRLRQEGIEVLTFPGSELTRGRGGARCLSCPIARDAITR